jgi:hypothetical protein
MNFTNKNYTFYIHNVNQHFKHTQYTFTRHLRGYFIHVFETSLRAFYTRLRDISFFLTSTLPLYLMFFNTM